MRRGSASGESLESVTCTSHCTTVYASNHDLRSFLMPSEVLNVRDWKRSRLAMHWWLGLLTDRCSFPFFVKHPLSHHFRTWHPPPLLTETTFASPNVG